MRSSEMTHCCRELRWYFILTLVIAGLGVFPRGGQCDAHVCDCPYPGDGNADLYIDVDDVIFIQNLILGGGTDIQDPDCPTTRGDYNADGFVDVVDLYLVFEQYLGQTEPPSDPCACGYPCELPPAIGYATVWVESKNVDPGTVDTIGIYVSNSTAIYGLVVPLAIRAITAYPAAITARWVPEGRVDTWMLGTTILAYDNESGLCGFAPPGGLGNTSPDAVVFLNTLDSRLPAGADTLVPSMQIIITTPDSTGSFMIDSTCADPGHHLAFFEGRDYAKGIPSFHRGDITVGACDCPNQGDFNTDGQLDALDLNYLIEIIFFQAPDVRDPNCPTGRSDINVDGFPDALDLNYLIQHLFYKGPPPVDPCG